MMKKLLSIILLLACVSVAIGQNRLAVTPFVGGRYASLVGSDVSNYFNGRLGYSLGAEIEWHASPLVGISLGVYFSKNVVAVNKTSYGLGVVNMAGLHYISISGKKGTDWDFVNVWGDNQTDVSHSDVYIKRSNYRFCTTSLEFPVLAHLHVWKGLAVKAGIQLNVALSSKIKCDYEYVVRHPSFVNASDGPYSSSTEDDQSADIDDYISRLSLSVPVGVSYEYKNVVLDVRYAFGLTSYGDASPIKSQKDISDDLRIIGVSVPELDGAVNSRQNMLTFTLGYRFNL